ncbi:hypothetical protein [Nocardia africana]|uniref:Uncharacterized protein n=1 Tax=Nocardia africana TaxID=134964 RepID=A0A379X4I9_9NOCA|nr:hypothetical protein [Nocardia africana]MCC3318426.1 hypothetical protein [Nocardia africana]SUH71881.1 Uncharacterised protein [Nocardia africana]
MITTIAKPLPPEVYQPLLTIASFALWTALMLCLGWFLIAAGRFHAAWRNGGGFEAAMDSLGRPLLGSIICSSSLGIATAVINSIQQ